MMFNSVSACTPNSVVTVDFFSSKSQTLSIQQSVTLSVNGSVIPSGVVELLEGDHVEATLTTPLSYLGYRIYTYILDSLKQEFAIVNKNDYRPSVKTTDARKKWFNYVPQKFLISFYKSTRTNQQLIGFNKNFIPNISSYHIVLDHINDAVCFYLKSEELFSKVNLPAGPIEYRKFSKIDPVTNKLITEAVVLCADKKMYRITFRTYSINTNTFDPVVTPVGTFNNNLPFEADLPSGQSYTDARRAYYRSKINPIVTSFDINQRSANAHIWVVGQGSIYYLNDQFQLLNTFSSALDKFASIACIDNGAIVVTTLGIIYYVSNSGNFTQLTNLGQNVNSVGTPSSILDGSYVAIPDPNNRRIIVTNYNGAGVYYISTPNMAPAYARQFDQNLWVTGHDNNVALSIDQNNQIKEYAFDNKITLVSVVGNSCLAVHYLQEFSTLNFLAPSGITVKKIIPFQFDDKTGPLSHIGSRPMQVKMLGVESIAAYTNSGDLSYWVNGAKGATNTKFNTGDYLGISFKAYSNGIYRRTVVIGETAIDCNFTVVSSTKQSDFFVPGTVALTRYSSLTEYSYIKADVDTGSRDTGVDSILLPFNLTMYGLAKTTINVATDGYITFGQNIPMGNVAIGSLTTDALYVEAARDLYLGAPIDNTNPLNVRTATLSSVPGVYYKKGILGDFNFIRIRWVGSEVQPYPLGNVVVTTAPTTSSTKVFVDLVGDVNVGDYVSGTGITVSTRISSFTNSPDLTFIAVDVNIISNFIRVEYNSTSKLYFTNSVNLTLVGDPLLVTDSSGSVLYGNTFVVSAPGTVITNPTTVPLVLIDTFNNLFLFNGTVDTDVDTSYYVVLNSSMYGPGPEVYLDGIQTIDRINISIICIGHLISGTSTQSVNEFYVSASDYNKVYINTVITNIPFGKVASKRFDGDYVISTDGYNSITIGNTYTIQITKIQMASLTVGGYFLIYYASVNNLGFNGIPVKFHRIGFEVANTSFIPNGATLIVKQKYFTLDNPASITVGTNLLVKTILPVKELTYEVGIYVGRALQYIEYFYDNSNHLSTANVGISSSSLKSIYTTTTNANGSIVFASEAGTGDWSLLGTGSFSYVDQGFQPYNKFQIFRPVTVPRKNETKIEILMSQSILTSSNIYISAEFGILAINGSEYIDGVAIKENDMISLTVPFNTSQKLVTPLISIGNYKFAVPMISDSVFFPNGRTTAPYYGYQLKETLFLYDNQNPNTSITATVTIPLSDTYYIPDYYRSPGVGISQAYFLTRDTTIIRGILQPGNYFDLRAGDIITIENILTPASIYDVRDTLISTSSRILRISVRTGPGVIFNYINFGTVIEPYARGITYTSDPLNGLLSYTGETFFTSNLILTANTSVSGASLYIDTAYANLIINNVDKGKYATNVSTSDIISIRRTIVNYLDSNVTLYQVKTDTTLSSKVYIPIGNWGLQNKIITNGVVFPKENSSKHNIAPSSVFNTDEIKIKIRANVDIKNSPDIKAKAPEIFLEKLKYTNVPKIKTVKISSYSNNRFRAPLSIKSPGINLVKSKKIPINLNNTYSYIMSTSAVPHAMGHFSYIKSTQMTFVLPHSISYFSIGAYTPVLPHSISYFSIGAYTPVLPHSISYFSIGAYTPVLPHSISYIENKGLISKTDAITTYYVSEGYQSKANPIISYFESKGYSPTSDTITTYYENKGFIAATDINSAYFKHTVGDAKTDTITTYVEASFGNAKTDSMTTYAELSLGDAKTDTITTYVEASLGNAKTDSMTTYAELSLGDAKTDSMTTYAELSLGDAKTYPLPTYYEQTLGDATTDSMETYYVNDTFSAGQEVNSTQLIKEINDFNLLRDGQQLESNTTPYNDTSIQYSEIHIPFRQETGTDGSHHKVDATTEYITSEISSNIPPEKITDVDLSIFLTPIIIHDYEISSRVEPVIEQFISEFSANTTPIITQPIELKTNLAPSLESNEGNHIGRIDPYAEINEAMFSQTLYPIMDIETVLQDNLTPAAGMPSELVGPMDPILESEDPFRLSTPLVPKFDLDHLSSQLLPPVMEVDTDLLQELLPQPDVDTGLLQELPPQPDVDTGLLQELPPYMDVEPNILQELPPQLDIEPSTLKELPPQLDVEPDILKELIPQLDVEPSILKELLPQLDVERRTMVSLISEFQAQIMYTTKELDQVSSFYTYIKIYALGNLGDTTKYIDPVIGPIGKPFSREYKYVSAAYRTRYDASIEAGKYNAADVVKVGTDYWNYRVYFDTRHFCIPKKGRLFPTSWYISGG